MRPQPSAILSEAALLDAVHRSALFEAESQEAIQRTLRLAARVLNAPLALLSIGDRERQVVRMHDASGVAQLGDVAAILQDRYGRPAFTTCEDVLVGDAGAQQRIRRTIIASPLDLAGHPVPLGTLAIVDGRERTDHEHAAAVLRELAAELTDQLWLRAENAARREKEAHLHSQKEVFGLIAEGAPIAHVMHSLATHIEHQVPGTFCSIQLLEEDGLLHVAAGPTLPESLLALIDAVPPAVHGCIGARAAFAGEPMIVADLSDDASTEPSMRAMREQGIRSGWSFPIVARGEVYGTINLYRNNVGTPGEEYLHLISVASSTARIAVDRQRAEAELRASEIYHRALIENSSEYILVLAADGSTRYVSGRVAQAIGCRPEDVQRLTDIVKPDDHPQAHALIQDLLKSGEKEFELRLAARDGSVRYLIGTGMNLLADPAVQGLVINARDVTQQTLANEQLRQAQRMEAIGRLAGGIAHDFNNLLTVIEGFTAMLLEELTDEEQRLPLTEIQKASSRAASLTRQLLAFSRRQVLQPRYLDMNQVVQGVGGMLRRLIPADIRLESTLDSGDLVVHADMGQIEQVILNLVINAQEAIAGSGTVTIRTDAVALSTAQRARHRGAQSGVYARLAVEDTGCGMDAQTIAEIFEPFFTTKESGTGLGLATVYGIVEQSGGHIEVRSTPGIGSCFEVFLPLKSESAACLSAPEARGTAQQRGSETILLVEDDSAVRDLTARILARYGYEVLAAEDGPAALALIADAHVAPELLLTDVVLPQMSGPVVAEHVKAMQPDIAIVFMSGYTDEQLGQRGILSADVAFLQKPFPSQRLLQLVREQLKARAAAVQARAGNGGAPMQDQTRHGLIAHCR